MDIRQRVDRVLAGVETCARRADPSAAFIDFDPVFVSARLCVLERYMRALSALLERPSIEQRTPEWYAARGDMITASDFAQALGLGKFGSKKQLLRKKCGFGDTFDANCAPIQWGVRYEKVACDIYIKRNNGIRVHEFGLLRHPEKAFIGASPDGITEFGVMLEIKCPYRRKITGEVPDQYMYQIQGQLEVCNLDECDYLEVGLHEVGADEFWRRHAEGTFPTEYGIVAEESDGKFTYSTPETIDAFNSEYGGYMRLYYWYLHTYSCVRIDRNYSFAKTLLEDVEKVWRQVEQYRSDPCLCNAELNNNKVKSPMSNKQAPINLFRDPVKKPESRALDLDDSILPNTPSDH